MRKLVSINTSIDAFIVRLVELIRKDNRKISQKVLEKVKRGEAIIGEYLS